MGRNTTAKESLQQWFDADDTPPDAWRTWTYRKIGKDAKIGHASVGRHLPAMVAKHLKCLPSEVIAQRKAYREAFGEGMTDEKLQKLKAYRQEQPPKSIEDCAFLLEISEYLVNKYCEREGW